MIQLITSVLTLIIFAATSSAKPISADISAQRIELHASFTGMDLLLFGARNEAGDIVVVVRGPALNITVRQKERIAGMWMFTRKAKYDALSQFMAVASTRPLQELHIEPLLMQLQLTPVSVVTASSADTATDAQFNTAVLRLKERAKLYTNTPSRITFFGETLFKTRIHFPDTMPRGNYVAEIYLIEDGALISSQTIPIYAVKTGFDAWVYDTAHEQPLAYGLLCIVIALSSGWIAHRIFRKR